MRQRFFVDRGALVAYLAVTLAACRSTPGALVPVAAQPVSRAQVPSGSPPPCRWSTGCIDSSGCSRTSGRARAGGAAPALRRPIRSGSTSRDRSDPVPQPRRWSATSRSGPSRPTRSKKLVPNYPLMWALLGVARLPEPRRLAAGADRGRDHCLAVRQRHDTVDYVRTTGKRASWSTEVRHAGKVVGRAETALDSAGCRSPPAWWCRARRPSSTSPSFPTARAAFAPDIWTARQP